MAAAESPSRNHTATPEAKGSRAGETRAGNTATGRVAGPDTTGVSAGPCAAPPAARPIPAASTPKTRILAATHAWSLRRAELRNDGPPRSRNGPLDFERSRETPCSPSSAVGVITLRSTAGRLVRAAAKKRGTRPPSPGRRFRLETRGGPAGREVANRPRRDPLAGERAKTRAPQGGDAPGPRRDCAVPAICSRDQIPWGCGLGGGASAGAFAPAALDELLDLALAESGFPQDRGRVGVQR